MVLQENLNSRPGKHQRSVSIATKASLINKANSVITSKLSLTNEKERYTRKR